ncbi:hypothetical protein LIER_37169 [Lithospermum erythrorhizon]|uniref:Uncharacterized protein n=1 Tax=Lithospermum erythrorhizon TaxID=34254 RepID=A0AAV3PHJ9_LITER
MSLNNPAEVSLANALLGDLEAYQVMIREAARRMMQDEEPCHHTTEDSEDEELTPKDSNSYGSIPSMPTRDLQ